MNRKERRDLTDSSQREHRIGFEGPGEQRSGDSLFQLALEVEDLLDKQKLKRDLGVIWICRYIEYVLRNSNCEFQFIAETS